MPVDAPERLRIDRLGAGGDGVADGRDVPCYVPGALPGETVLAEAAGARWRLLKVETPSPARAEPFCPYFGRCGGCAAQHMAPELYGGWKRHRLLAALSQAGLSAPVEPLLDAGGEGRRRVILHVRRIADEVAVGFMEARSHRLVSVERCPILVPALGPAPSVAAALAQTLKPVNKPLDVATTATVSGLDVDLRGSGPLPERLRRALVARAEQLDLARLSLHGDVLVERRSPIIEIGRARVAPPPGGFLQATASGEAALAEAVLIAIGKARRVADLFAGSGPFALRMAEHAAVHAVEADGAALAALGRAARSTPGLRPVTTETRDLFRRPLLAPELDRFDAVVLDPPRAGAEAQARQVATSSLDTVVMASCDPGTFARDAAILVGGGFHLDRVLPVDQFKWSPHLEIVGVFRRPTGSRRRSGRRRQG